ncbi:hypothetical protein CCACVL1_07624, partial [Corchorus capsularis]
GKQQIEAFEVKNKFIYKEFDPTIP